MEGDEEEEEEEGKRSQSIWRRNEYGNERGGELGI